LRLSISFPRKPEKFTMTMTRCIRIVCLLLMFLAVSQKVKASDKWGRQYLPNNPVVTQHGQHLQFYDNVLKNKIVVISFIYTSCRDICPIITARLSQLEEKLGDVVGRDIFFVSISIDPENDTPAKLKEYAEVFQTGPGWLFLTGNPADIETIRYKLGDRRAKLSDHRNEVLLYNDSTGDWETASAFGDLNALVVTVRAMDPAWRNAKAGAEAATPQPATRTEAAHINSIGLPGQALFIKTCGSCHTIGKGEKVGPDLFGVTSRRNRSWLSTYITAPDKMRSQGDPIALELGAKYRAVKMPNLQLSEVDASDVIAFIDAQTYAAEADRKNPPAHEHHHHDHNH
jgi:protein SCO1/2